MRTSYWRPLSPIVFGSQFHFLGSLKTIWWSFLGLKKISTKLSGKRKFSTKSVNQCQGHFQGNFFLFLCVTLFYIQWAVHFRHFLLEVCQVHQLVVKNICCHSKWWRDKLNKGYGPLRAVLGGTGVNGLKMLRQRTQGLDSRGPPKFRCILSIVS